MWNLSVCDGLKRVDVMVIKIIDIYTVSTKNGHLFIFSIALSKLADFNAFLCGNSRENWTLTVYIFDRLTYLL